MRWLAVAVLVGGWAFAGWQNRPRLVDADPLVFAVAICASLAAAFWFGRRSGRASAVAVATARAEARAAAAAKSVAHAQQAVVVNVDTGARAAGMRDLGGLERAEWIGPAVPLLEQDSREQVEDGDEHWSVAEQGEALEA